MDGSTSCAEAATQIGNILSGSWELTQRIFENLNFHEVSRLRSVCKTWADVGAKILEKRRRFHYLTIHPNDIPTTEGKVAIGEASPASLFEGFFERVVSRPRYCLAFCNEKWLNRTDLFHTKEENGKTTLVQRMDRSLPLPCEFGLVCATGVVGTVENHYQGHWLQSANSVNREILSLFCGGGGGEGRERGPAPRCWGPREAKGPNREAKGPNREAKGPNREQEAQREGVSTRSQSGGARPPSEDAGEERSSVGYSIEVEQNSTSLSQSDAFSLLLIPHHPGVQLKFFHICEEKFLKEFRKEEDASCDNLTITVDELNQLTSMAPDDHLKALLLFDAGLDEGFIEAFIQSALVRQNHKLALGGGVADSVYAERSSSSTQRSFGVAVCGPNVMAASVVIPKYVGNPKDLEEYMKELKSCGLPEDHSVAFMFSCCGRGYSWYRLRGNPWFDYHNVETKAFRQAFPNTPIFGFFGGGEIGLNHLPKYQKQEEEEQGVRHKKRKKRMLHQFSTIIVLLSFL